MSSFGVRARSFLLALAFHAAPASAVETLDDVAAFAGENADVQVNGYVDARLQYAHVVPLGLLPTADIPAFSALLEGNVELTVPLSSAAFAYADVSLFYQAGAVFYDADREGHAVQIPDHDVATLHPRAVPSELYASYAPRPWLSLLAGRKRITWGSGVAFNPTDLLNPPRDPTDPTLQRAGAWLVRAEAPFERYTFSALYAPALAASGDGFAADRYLAAARAYALFADTDLNAIYYYSNRYRTEDDFAAKSRLGLSFSRLFFTDWELHAEALLSLGTTRRYADPNAKAVLAAASERRLGSDAFLPRVLVGTRRTFPDESTVSLEYYFQADGYSQGEFGDFVRLLSKAKSQGLTNTLLPATASSQSGLPQRFTFEPLRKHYLIAAYSRPKIFDDWTAGLTVIAGLADLSGLISPSVSYDPNGWLRLTAAAFVPVGTLPAGRACARATREGRCAESYSEFSLLPEDVRVLLEARVFY